MGYDAPQWGDGDPRLPVTAEKLQKLGQQYAQLVTDLFDPESPVGVLDPDGKVAASALPAGVYLIAGDPRVPQIVSTGEYLAGFMDTNRRLTELVVRRADGAVPDWVLERWALRLASMLNLVSERVLNPSPNVRGSASDLLGSDLWVDGAGELRPVLPNMASWSIWGSSTASGFASRLATLATGHGATSVSGATGGWRSAEICARLGSRPFLLSEEITVPADTTPVTAPSTNVGGNPYVPRSFDGYWTGHPDRPGTLSAIASSSAPWTFTPTDSGTGFTVPADTAFVPDLGTAHRADLLVLNIGKNDWAISGWDWRTTFDRTVQAFAYAAPLVKRVLVIGHFVDSNETNPAVKASIAAYNAACAALFGVNFFDLQGYLMGEDVWTETAIDPTGDDLDAQADGVKPPSLSADSQHMNQPTYTAAFARGIEERMTDLGWIS